MDAILRSQKSNLSIFKFSVRNYKWPSLTMPTSPEKEKAEISLRKSSKKSTQERAHVLLGALFPDLVSPENERNTEFMLDP